MKVIRKFKIIVDSKECGTCSGSSPGSVSKKVVKKLCDDSKKIVKFSLKECKRDCKKICGPYKGFMEKLDKPYKRNKKLITHRAVCEKVQVKKMRGGIINKNKGDNLDINDFLVNMDSNSLPQPLKIKVIDGLFGTRKTYYIFFDILSEQNLNQSEQNHISNEHIQRKNNQLENNLSEHNQNENNPNENNQSGEHNQSEHNPNENNQNENNQNENNLTEPENNTYSGGTGMYYTYVAIKYSSGMSDKVIFKKLDSPANITPVDIIHIPKLTLVKLYQDIISSNEFKADNTFANTIRKTITENVVNIQLFIDFLAEKDKTNRIKSLKIIGNSIFFRVRVFPSDHYEYVATIDHKNGNIMFEQLVNTFNLEDYNNLHREQININMIQNHILQVFLKNLTNIIIEYRNSNINKTIIRSLLFIRDYLFVYFNIWVDSSEQESSNFSDIKRFEDDIAKYIFFSLKRNQNTTNTMQMFFFEYVIIINKITNKITCKQIMIIFFSNVKRIKSINILNIEGLSELYRILKDTKNKNLSEIKRQIEHIELTNEDLKISNNSNSQIGEVNSINEMQSTIYQHYKLTEENKRNTSEKIKIITVGTGSGRFGNQITYIFFSKDDSFEDNIEYYQYVVIKYSKNGKNIVIFKKIKYKKDNNPEIKTVTMDEIKRNARVNRISIGIFVLEKLYQDIISSPEVKKDSNFATTIREELKKSTEYHKEKYLRPEMFSIKIKNSHNQTVSGEAHRKCSVFVNNKYIFFSNRMYSNGETIYQYVAFINDKNMIAFKELVFFNGTYLILPTIIDQSFSVLRELYKSINECRVLMEEGRDKSDIALNILYKLEEYILGNERNELKSRDFYVTTSKREFVTKIVKKSNQTYIFFNRLYNKFKSYILYKYVLVKNGNIIFKEINKVDFDSLLIGEIKEIDPTNIDIVILANLYESLDENSEDELQIKLYLNQYVEKYINFKNWVESILQSNITTSNLNHSKKIININKQPHDIGIVGQFKFDFMKEYKKQINREAGKKWLDNILETKKIVRNTTNANTYSFDPKLGSIADRRRYTAVSGGNVK
jgi:hypothetical protein